MDIKLKDKLVLLDLKSKFYICGVPKDHALDVARISRNIPDAWFLVYTEGTVYRISQKFIAGIDKKLKDFDTSNPEELIFRFRAPVPMEDVGLLWEDYGKTWFIEDNQEADGWWGRFGGRFN